MLALRQSALMPSIALCRGGRSLRVSVALFLALLVDQCQSLPEHYGVDANGLPTVPFKTRIKQYIQGKNASNRGSALPECGPGMTFAEPQHVTICSANCQNDVKSKNLPRVPQREVSHDFLVEQAKKAEASVEEDARSKGLVHAAVKLSLAVNICLFAAKIFAARASGSRAVLATMLDSFVDLMSQMVIAFAEWSMSKHDPEYPAGKSRLETVGVIVTAGIMSFSALSVLRTSLEDLISAEHTVTMGRSTYLILGAAVLSKLALFSLCSALRDKSASALALAEDHFNDILSNSGAIATAAAASMYPKLWYIDPIGGGIIALYIIVSWFHVARTHIDKIVGRSAPDEFVDELRTVTSAHHPLLTFEECRAYSFGQKYLVELDVILPGDMSVRDSHDIALHLQHKIEAMEDVERCFVHVDYRSRSNEPPEHKTERDLLAAVKAPKIRHRGSAGEFHAEHQLVLQPS